YSIVDSALGRLLVAGTKRGICFAAMGKSDRRLVAELRADYPRTSIRIADPNRRRIDSSVGKWARAIANYVAGRSKMPAPPMDIRGTPFQFSVWDQLRAIPAGQTRSYTEIARLIGRPRAVRSVPPTAQIPSRLSSRVIAQSVHRGISVATDGDSNASASCLRWKRRGPAPYLSKEKIRTESTLSTRRAQGGQKKRTLITCPGLGRPSARRRCRKFSPATP